MSTALLPPLAAGRGRPVAVWARPQHRSLFAGRRDVSQVLSYDPKGRHRGLAGLARFRASAARDGRAAGGGLGTPRSFSSALAAWASGARHRVGWAGQGRDPLLTRPLRARGEPRRRHWIEEQGGLLPAPPSKRCRRPSRRMPRRRSACAPCSRSGSCPRATAAFFVAGATYGDAKRWDGFAALAARLPGVADRRARRRGSDAPS